MARRGFGAEQIVSKLRQIEVLTAQGRPAALACKEAGISEQSYYRWRKEYGGLEIALAECVCRAADRFHPTRMPRSYRGLR